ncbi:type II toxin-antitoxin system [compost metagenome]
MLTIIPMSQARRRFRRLVTLVTKGHSFIITKNGKPLVLLDAPEPSDKQEQ